MNLHSIVIATVTVLVFIQYAFPGAVQTLHFHFPHGFVFFGIKDILPEFPFCKQVQQLFIFVFLDYFKAYFAFGAVYIVQRLRASQIFTLGI